MSDKFCLVCGNRLVRREDEQKCNFQDRTTCSKQCAIRKMVQTRNGVNPPPASPRIKYCHYCQALPVQESSDFCSDECLNAHFKPVRTPAAVTCPKCSRMATHGKYCSRHGD